MKKICYILVACLFFIDCSNTQNKFPKNFDYGKVENGTYTNQYFNLEVPINPNWIIQNKEQVNNIIEKGSKLVANNNKNTKALIDASKINTAYLLTMFKYEVGAAVNYNPSLIIVAENIKDTPGIKRGSDYLFHTKNILEQAQIKYNFEKEIYEKQIGNSSFDVMESTIDVIGKTITQDYISAIKNGFSLSFIISYLNEDEKKELYRIIENIKI